MLMVTRQAAIALIGLLLVLPWSLGTATAKAEDNKNGWVLVLSDDGTEPLGTWQQIRSFDSASQCEDQRYDFAKEIKEGKFPDGTRVVVKPGTIGEAVKKGAELKCVPADAYYRAVAAAESQRRGDEAARGLTGRR